MGLILMGRLSVADNVRVSELPGGGWRLTGPTDSLPSVVGSPDKARQRRLREPRAILSPQINP